MTELAQPEEVAASNDRSLKTLSRAITLSAGQFALILVRCNYAALQQLQQQRLQELCCVRLSQLFLPSSIKTLYTTILKALASEPTPQMVFGLESVTAIDQVLISTNQVRDEFRKNLTFPLVLWVTDEVLQKLTRFAPDFKSWAATSIKFELDNDELIAVWRQTALELFTTILQSGVGEFLPNNALDLAPGCRRRGELESAQRDLASRGISLEPILQATWEFILGRDAYATDQLDDALEHYRQSLQIGNGLESLVTCPSSVVFRSSQHEATSHSSLSAPPNSPPAIAGIVLFHIGLCYSRKASMEPTQSENHWEQARGYFQQSLETFERQARPDLAAEIYSHLGEVLRRGEAWEDLQALAYRSLTQAETYNSPVLLAQAYGFLAFVARSRQNSVEAGRLAELALEHLAQSPTARSQQRGLYLLILGSSLRQVGQLEAAVHYLELARDETEPQKINQGLGFKPGVSPQLYIDILEELRSLYFQMGQFWSAFQLKQEQRSIGQQYGFSPFLGAAPLQPHPAGLGAASAQIAAAGRQQDVNRLIERISRNDHKLTIIHGASGVGKSSLINAGLVPQLKVSILGARQTLPVVLQVYTDWLAELGKRLAEARGELRSFSSGDLRQYQPSDAEVIVKQIEQNAGQNLLTVLIFDQFEEFFFVGAGTEARQQFYDFLAQCLNLPFVKVILSLRTDFLHYLLECDRHSNLDVINNNILDKDIRYCLEDLSPEEAKSVILSLTQCQNRPVSSPPLESELIDAFVRDLARERGSVRLVELQVVGAQLQAEQIKTLEQYQQLGADPKAALVERSLGDVIRDCGQENEDAVWSVLFSLTNERGIRPLKTKPELFISLFAIDYHEKSTIHSQQLTLDLIFNILVGSGLVLRVPEQPENRYQLVHDYLVEPIRKVYHQRSQLNMAVQLASKEEQETQLIASLHRVRKQKLRAVAIGITMSIFAVAAVAFALGAETERKRAVIAENNAQLSARSASSEALFVSHKEFDALIEGLRAGRLLQKSPGVETDTKIQVLTALEQSVYGVKELNRLEGHADVVWHICFSPDGKTIASSSRDKTVKLWRTDGTLISNLKGHKDSVTSASFSPDGQKIASASWDNTVKIWRPDGVLLQTLQGHGGYVFSVTFSPDGQSLASASADGTVKIWTVGGKLLKTLKSHQGGVTWVTFSPDGQLIASAGEDKTVKLWDRTGKMLKTLVDHTGKVNYVSFSSDSQQLASASDDKRVKLWDRTGKLLKTLDGHEAWVFGTSFSPDGKIVAGASKDNTVRLWQRDASEEDALPPQLLQGHGDGVTSVQFSPDGKTIASASYDKTVRIWERKERGRKALTGHSDEVIDVSFSPDGQTIASASADNTIKLWNRAGKLLTTLKGHTDKVLSVTFSPDGKTIAAASRDKKVKLWSKTGKLIKTLIGHADWVLDVSFSPDGKFLASASRDKTIKMWSSTGSLIKTLKGHGDRVNSVTFSPDGQLMASTSDDKTVKLWTSEGKLLKTLQGHLNWVLDVSFSPDGQQLASASYDNTVKLWNRRGDELRTLKGPSDSVAHVSFSPDGQILATTSWDNRVQLWRLDDTLIKTLEGHSDRVTSVSWRPDGKGLASASNDGTVILWNLDLDDLLKQSCTWLQDYLQTNPKVRKSDRQLCDN
jgi:WD40 repeat protein/tetratricopeptide (TPR) repeat protein